VNIHPDGRWDAYLMLTDFGLAKIVGEEMVLSSATASVDSFAGEQQIPSDAGALIGTFEYMSPEQRRGEPATPASDLFTVGIMMLRLLTGAKELGLRSRPSKLRPDLHRGWDKVILKAIRESPTERFPHAISMAMAINELDLTV
jgi:serine/threonine protein kinase